MIVGSWTYSISNAIAIKAYNTAAEYFKKYGAEVEHLTVGGPM